MAARKKSDRFVRSRRLTLAAMGLEAEFALVVDDVPTRPEQLFASPRDFIRGALMHREGTSYHLPTGAAVYFDTGVIEVATPVIEIERGCAARAGRSLWEAVHFLRAELDAWQARTGHDARLVGFSAHYNVSFELPGGEPPAGRTVEKLALLLSYILPVPVMLLATNRRSTGVGVRPRKDRIEITVDFTPDAALMIATASLIVGVVRDVMRWPSYELPELEAHGIPVIRDFAPVPHTSRKGWLAGSGCYPDNPFTCNVDEPMWQTTAGERMSLRAIAAHTVRTFRRSIHALADPFAFGVIASVITRRVPSLLDRDDRPVEYEDVGRLCVWDELFPPTELTRSRYESVLLRAVSGSRLHVNGRTLRPVGMRGWSAVVFRNDENGGREIIPIDELVHHLAHW